MIDFNSTVSNICTSTLQCFQVSLEEKNNYPPIPVWLFSFSQLCVEKPGMSVGILASVPLISDSELLQAEDEAPYSFTCGSFTKMTKYKHFLYLQDQFSTCEDRCMKKCKESK